MQAHGIGTVDVLIAAIGNNFEAQVLAVVHAKELGIKKIVARATTPDHHRVLVAVGADHVFNPEEEAARWMVQRLLITNISSYFELAEGFSVVEVKAAAGIVGKSLKELNLRRRFRINVVALKRMSTTREGESVLKEFNPVPQPDEVIQEGDLLSLVGSVLDLANFMGEYT
jgi:trk system potassium uptake protein TrkA